VTRLKPKIEETLLSKTYEDLKNAERLVHGSTLIGAGLCIKGEVSGHEDVLVEGLIEGRLQLTEGMLTVRPNGKINANIEARAVVVYGDVKGNIAAPDRIEIKKEGSVAGDLSTARIIIDDGATFKGSIEIVREATVAIVDRKAAH